MSNLDALLAAAKDKAADMTNSLPAVAGGAGVPVAASVGGGVTYNMNEDAFLNPGGMEVSSYISIKDAGIKLSKDWNGYIDEFEALIDMREVQYFMGIRKEVGNNVSYAKTYDGVSTPRGENFAAVVAEFQRTSQKPADVYRGADIPMEVLTDIADPKGKGPVIEAGTTVGLSTSITGFKPFAAFAKKVKLAGLGEKQLRIKVTHEPRKNANNQAYGICQFDVIEVVGQAQAA